MTRSNLAFKNTEAADTSLEFEEPGQNDTNRSYIGESTIRRFVGKTGDGTKIEDFLKEIPDSTTIVNQPFSVNTILPKRNFLLEQTAGYSIVLQKWNGYIDQIDGKEFTAVLTDPAGKNPDIKAAFSIDEVSRGDRGLVRENALFDWLICRETKSYGQIENKDFLIFKRFPMWKKSDLDESSAEVEEFDTWLNSDDTN